MVGVESPRAATFAFVRASYHEKFKDWAGLWVFAEVDDGWGVGVIVWPDEPWKDRRAVLYCTNESDWLAADPETAGTTYSGSTHSDRSIVTGA